MRSDSDARRIFFAVLLMAPWISSRDGFMDTFGTVSSTSTPKMGRSTYKKPPLDLEPSRFFIARNDARVAVKIAWYISFA